MFQFQFQTLLNLNTSKTTIDMANGSTNDMDFAITKTKLWQQSSFNLDWYVRPWFGAISVTISVFNK